VKNLLEFATTTFTDARPETPGLLPTPELQWLFISDGEYPTVRCHTNHQCADKQCDWRIARLPSKFFATSAPPRDSAALAFRVPALLLDGGAQAMTADGICVV
jgi:hypothetical protein